MMIRPLLFLLAVPIYFATPASAGNGVGDGYWSFGGDQVSLDVTENPNDPNKVWVTATDDTGFSTATNGTAGADSTSTDPTVQTTGTISTNGHEYKVTGGKQGAKVYRKNKRGEWVPGKKVKNKSPKKGKGANGPKPRTLIGNNVTSIPI